MGSCAAGSAAVVGALADPTVVAVMTTVGGIAAVIGTAVTVAPLLTPH